MAHELQTISEALAWLAARRVVSLATDSRESRAEMVASDTGKAWFADGAKFIGAVRSILLSERVVIAPPA